MNWLLVNLLSFYSKHAKWLRQIDVDLMEKLVGHPDLFVIQTEFSLYMLLRHWMFLHLHPITTSKDDSENSSNIEKTLPIYKPRYFSKLKDKTPFLQKLEGRKFERVFRRLRLHNLLQHPHDLNAILDDNILPRDWLNGPVMSQWTSMLNIDQNLEMGYNAIKYITIIYYNLTYNYFRPQECEPDRFYSSCLRVGRVINEKSHQKWRWTGYNFGLDLVFITDTRALYVKRHHRTEHERMLSLQTKRHIIMRLVIKILKMPIILINK